MLNYVDNLVSYKNSTENHQNLKSDFKPNNCKLLNDFLEEYKKLEVTGMYFNQVLFHVKIWSILCDAPARQFLKSVKSHTGYYGCERCEVKGESIEHRLVYRSCSEPLRIDAKFNNMEYPNHQLGRSPFIDSTISCISDVPLDYMHSPK